MRCVVLKGERNWGAGFVFLLKKGSRYVHNQSKNAPYLLYIHTFVVTL